MNSDKEKVTEKVTEEGTEEVTEEGTEKVTEEGTGKPVPRLIGSAKDKMDDKPIILKRITDDMSLREIATTATPMSWREVFIDAKDEYNHIEKMISKSEYFPIKKNIFKAFEYTALEDVKVVIIGQDPYPDRKANGFPRAQGLSFSASRNDIVPKSLINVYKELERTIEGFKAPKHGDLTKWAMQGVLLLNASLTVEVGKPKSHGVLWHGVIMRVLAAIEEINPKCIYLLWGNDAREIKSYIPKSSTLLEAGHPSPLNRKNDFVGCDHFILVNENLIKQGKTPIDWTLD